MLRSNERFEGWGPCSERTRHSKKNKKTESLTVEKGKEWMKAGERYKTAYARFIEKVAFATEVGSLQEGIKTNTERRQLGASKVKQSSPLVCVGEVQVGSRGKKWVSHAATTLESCPYTRKVERKSKLGSSYKKENVFQ